MTLNETVYPFEIADMSEAQKRPERPEEGKLLLSALRNEPSRSTVTASGCTRIEPTRVRPCVH